MSSAPHDSHRAPQHLVDAWERLKRQDEADAAAHARRLRAVKEDTAKDHRFVALKTALQAKPPSPMRDAIIQRLDDGVYGDYTSEIACPKMTLADHLDLAGFMDLQRRTIQGDFDF